MGFLHSFGICFVKKFCIVGMPQFAQIFAEFLGGYILQICTAFCTYFCHDFSVVFAWLQTHFVSIFTPIFLWKNTQKTQHVCQKNAILTDQLATTLQVGNFCPKQPRFTAQFFVLKHKKMHPRLESAFVICWEFDFVDLHQTLRLNKTQNNRNFPTRLLAEQRAFRR